MKVLILLFLLGQIFAHPINDDRMHFPDDSDENFYTRFQKVSNDPEWVEGRFDDNVDDLKFDLSFLLNDTNILRSANDTEEILFEIQKVGKSKYGRHFQGDIALMPNQIIALNASDDISDRTGLKSAIYRWPKDKNGNVVVPYILSNEYC